MENLERNCFHRIMFLFDIDILAFEPRKLCPGVGILFRFLDPGARVLHRKAVPRVGILTERISGLGISLGGMVTALANI